MDYSQYIIDNPIKTLVVPVVTIAMVAISRSLWKDHKHETHHVHKVKHPPLHYTVDHNQIDHILLIGGPAHGTKLAVESGIPTYTVFTQKPYPVKEGPSAYTNRQPDMPVPGVDYHRYRRIPFTNDFKYEGLIAQ